MRRLDEDDDQMPDWWICEYELLHRRMRRDHGCDGHRSRFQGG
jgi:hypothetical protein